MPKEDNEILDFNHEKKSMKVRFINYVDLECLLEKVSTFLNPEVFK